MGGPPPRDGPRPDMGPPNEGRMGFGGPGPGQSHIGLSRCQASLCQDDSLELCSGLIPALATNLLEPLTTSSAPAQQCQGLVVLSLYFGMQICTK